MKTGSMLDVMASMVILAPCAWQQDVAAQERESRSIDGSTSSPPSDVVVVGRRPRGAVDADQEPTLTLDQRAIRSYGATDLSELLRALGPSARWGGADEPITLLNGRRVAGFSVIAGIPPEALERVDVLPGPAALKLGLPPDRGVINFVTLKRYRSAQLEMIVGTTTEGGGSNVRTIGGATTIRDERRIVLSADLRHRQALRQSRRTLPPFEVVATGSGETVDVTSLRDLLPRNDVVNIVGTWTGPVGAKVLATGSLSYDLERNAGLQVSANNTFDGEALENAAGGSGGSRLLSPVTVSTRRSAITGTLQFEGYRGETSWNVTLEHERATRSASASGDTRGLGQAHSDRRSELDGQQAGTAGIRSVRTVALLTSSGPLVELPAGPMSLTGSVRGELLRAGRSVVDTAARSREAADMTAAFVLPLAGARGRSVPLPGTFSLNASFGVSRVSDFGAANLFGYGGSWAPVEQLQLLWSTTERRVAPPLDQLLTPAISTPTVPLFDPQRSETYGVDTLIGGNAELRPERERTSTLGLSVQPFRRRQFRVEASVTRSLTRDRIVQPSGVTSAFEGLTGRVVRTSDGRIAMADLRPFNVYAERSDVLNGEVSYSGPLRFWSHATTGRSGTTITASVAPLFRLADVICVDRGAERLDLLEGQGFQGATATSRFELDVSTSLIRGGFGLNVALRRIGTARIADDRAASDLRFGSITTLNMGTFFVLEGRRGAKPVSTATIKLRIDNALNRRRSVRDRTGSVPDRFSAAYLDPLGRTVSLAVRSVF